MKVVQYEPAEGHSQGDLPKNSCGDDEVMMMLMMMTMMMVMVAMMMPMLMMMTMTMMMIMTMMILCGQVWAGERPNQNNYGLTFLVGSAFNSGLSSASAKEKETNQMMMMMATMAIR